MSKLLCQVCDGDVNMRDPDFVVSEVCVWTSCMHIFHKTCIEKELAHQANVFQARDEDDDDNDSGWSGECPICERACPDAGYGCDRCYASFDFEHFCKELEKGGKVARPLEISDTAKSSSALVKLAERYLVDLEKLEDEEAEHEMSYWNEVDAWAEQWEDQAGEGMDEVDESMLDGEEPVWAEQLLSPDEYIDDVEAIKLDLAKKAEKMRKEDHREQMNLAMGLAQNMATLQHQHDKWAKQLAERHSSLRLMKVATKISDQLAVLNAKLDLLPLVAYQNRLLRRYDQENKEEKRAKEYAATQAASAIARDAAVRNLKDELGRALAEKKHVEEEGELLKARLENAMTQVERVDRVIKFDPLVVASYTECQRSLADALGDADATRSELNSIRKELCQSKKDALAARDQVKSYKEENQQLKDKIHELLEDKKRIVAAQQTCLESWSAAESGSRRKDEQLALLTESVISMRNELQAMRNAL